MTKNHNINTTIKDVAIIPINKYEDSRGSLSVLASFERKDAPEMSKIEEVYFAEVPKHATIRAGHKHYKTEEIFVILEGSGKFVFVDDRKDSPTYGKINSFILNGKNKSALFTPIGVYHAWISIEDNTKCLAISSKAYHKEDTDTYQTDLAVFGNELKII
jgi:dTDP-4-dehydrorhamnose 3,5-epimerase